MDGTTRSAESFYRLSEDINGTVDTAYFAARGYVIRTFSSLVDGSLTRDYELTFPLLSENFRAPTNFSNE